MKSKKNSWTKSLFAYAEGEQKRLILSVLLSIFSVMLGLLPFYCMYEIICLFVAGTATKAAVIKWCLLALGIYAGKISKGEAVWIHENSNDSNVAMNTVSYWSGYYRLNMMEGR